MSFYSSWYKDTINNGNKTQLKHAPVALQADLTPAQVTVCTIQDKFVYNMEYKPTSPAETNTGRRTRQRTASSTYSFSSQDSGFTPARFQNHSRTHSRRHTRNFSSESEALSIISEDSMWDDWIVKFIEDKKTVSSDDAPMEDWIFETM